MKTHDSVNNFSPMLILTVTLEKKRKRRKREKEEGRRSLRIK